jgi:nitroreductase
MWAFETGIAAGNLMAQATGLGLIAHPMAGYDEPSVRNVFGAPDDVRVLAVFAIGYPGDPATLPDDLRERESSPQWRIPLSYLVGIDRWAPEQGISARELQDR